MKRWILLALLAAPVWALPARAGGEIYGTVRTTGGEVYTGPIRWDKNEVAWDDFLEGHKDHKVKSRDPGTRITVFGKEILDWIPGHSWAHPQFSIPFGHIRSLERKGSEARIETKGGEVFQVGGGGSDIGSSVRRIEVRDEQAGEIRLRWRDLDRIDFAQGPGAGIDGARLYGTVETRRGEYTGYVVWDKDETLASDILDGEEEGVDRKIPFAQIREIRRRDNRSARVRLQDGRWVVLSGTNDVNSDIRGIDVTVEGVGRVEIGWQAFQRVVLVEPPSSPPFDRYDGGRRLAGTVTTADGRRLEGRIVWDEDEEFTWETLDGEADGVEFSILFGNVKRIERLSGEASEVTLQDGKVLVLKGSNDVNAENKGIRIIAPSGEETPIGWGDFEAAEFSAP